MILFKDTDYKLDIGVIDRRGDFVTGLTVTYNVRKSSDNSLIASETATEVGSSGIYQTSSLSFSVVDKYRIEYTTPSKYDNVVEEILVIQDIADQVWDEALVDHQGAGSTGEALANASSGGASPSVIAQAVWDELTYGSGSSTFGEVLKRIAGLCQENFRIIDPVYSKGDLVAGLIKIYENANDVDTDTNPIGTYQVESTYNARREATGYKVKKIA